MQLSRPAPAGTHFAPPLANTSTNAQKISETLDNRSIGYLPYYGSEI
jgi:hypothetical protein